MYFVLAFTNSYLVLVTDKSLNFKGSLLNISLASLLIKLGLYLVFPTSKG